MESSYETKVNGDKYKESYELLKRDPDKYLEEFLRPKIDGLADSIMFCLFERARNKKNQNIYTPGLGPEIPRDIYLPNGRKIHIPGLSFLDYLLLSTEISHAIAGRYKHPEEFPFFDDYIPEPEIPRKTKEPHVISQAVKNVTKRIKALYIDTILTKICKDGDDDEYGSSSEWDIRCLQDLSKRVHIGYNVAESKFRKEPDRYRELIATKNFDGIKEALRVIPREQKLLENVKKIAEIYMDEEKYSIKPEANGIEIKPEEKNHEQRKFRVNPDIIVKLFKEDIIPLTLDVEVDYILRRANLPVD